MATIIYILFSVGVILFVMLMVFFVKEFKKLRKREIALFSKPRNINSEDK